MWETLGAGVHEVGTAMNSYRISGTPAVIQLVTGARGHWRQDVVYYSADVPALAATVGAHLLFSCTVADLQVPSWIPWRRKTPVVA